MSAVKLNNRVSYPMTLDMAEFCERPFIWTSYELFAAIVHVGQAHNGHYYAYTKDFATDQWRCCDDTVVTNVDESDLESTFGGDATMGNAYVLMYRQVHTDTVQSVANADVPSVVCERLTEAS
jgi:ubiquitin C-terminal hydrolase